MNKRKTAYSFYCPPCDHAWLEILETSKTIKYSLCEYCKVKRKGEPIPKNQ